LPDEKTAESSLSGPPPQYPIESVDNALKLLLLFVDQPRIRITEASAYLGVASSTAHRVLAMLQYRGFVRQDATRSYIPGPALTVLANAVNRQSDARALARPTLEQINAEVNETVTLGRLEGTHVHFLDSIEASQAVRVTSRAGRLMPANCSSTGKVLLSRFSDEELEALIPDRHLEGLTANSITSWDDLMVELGKIRKRGYATNHEESESGVVSVAVNVPSSTGGSHFALNIAAPVHRMTPALRNRCVSVLNDAVVDLGALIG